VRKQKKKIIEEFFAPISTDLKNNITPENSDNILTLSGSSLRATTPLDSHNTLDMLVRPKVEVLTIDKDAQLSTLKLNRIKSSVWKSPISLSLFPKNDPNMSLYERVILPVAIKPKFKISNGK